MKKFHFNNALPDILPTLQNPEFFVWVVLEEKHII